MKTITKNKLQNLILGILLTVCLIITVILLAYGSSNKNMNELSSIEETTTCTTMTTTTSATTTTTTTITTVTTVITTTTEATTTTTATHDIKDRFVDYGFFRATYYHGEGANPCPGGSGRMLLDCSPKLDEIKGSVACRRVQEDYGYNINGRTRVWLEFTKYPTMTGWYFVDDACRDYDVVDVYFIEYSDCPWEHDGNAEVHLWLEPS